MQKTNFRTVYDTVTVARILSEASGRALSVEDVRNLTRPGAALHRALVRGGTRGTYSIVIVKRVADKMTRRRLAADLGRVSPRFLDTSHSRACTQCGSIAVEWGGQVRCEEGHTYVEAVDPGAPGGDETVVMSLKKTAAGDIEIIGAQKILYQDGEPCKHPGCRSHVSHPCEGCGRTAARGVVYENLFIKQAEYEERLQDLADHG